MAGTCSLPAMRILAIDTCFGACSAAVTWPGGSASRCERMERGHAERLIPMIGEVMAEAPFALDRIEAIAVTLGPGTFTGLRIGIAAARAFALASGAKTYGLSSLELMARTARARLGEADVTDAGAAQWRGPDLAVAVDARRDEIYFQLFDQSLAAVTEPLLIAPRDAAEMLRGEHTVIVGSGAELIFGVARKSCEAVLPGLEPDARHMSDVSLAGLRPQPLQPLYLRPPDAKPQDGKSLSRTA